MKTRVILFTGLFILIFSSIRSQETTINSGHENKGTINVLSSAGLYDLTIKWASEYGRLNPNVTVKVTKASDDGITGVLKAGTGIGFITNESDHVLHLEPAWNMVVGRDVIVPVMNQSDLPHLRISNAYKDLLAQPGTALFYNLGTSLTVSSSAFANGGVMETCGQSTDIDTRFPHGQGAGLQALVFDY